jgi:hypothetical protein
MREFQFLTFDREYEHRQRDQQEPEIQPNAKHKNTKDRIE